MNGSNGFVPPNTPPPPTNASSFNNKRPRRDTSRIGKILLFVGLALLLVTAGTAGVYLFSGSALTSQRVTTKPTVQPTPTPTVHVQHQQIAAQYVANMSLDDEIAQLIMIEHNAPSYSPDLDVMINQQHVGSVIMYATAIVTRAQVQHDTGQMQAHAKIPVFISID